MKTVKYLAAAAMLLAAGCGEDKEATTGAVALAPRIAAGTTIAFYGNDSAVADDPALKELNDKLEAQAAEGDKAILDAIKESGLQDVEWSVATIGEITRPADDAEGIALPKIAVVAKAKGVFAIDGIVALVKENLAEGGYGMRIEEATVKGLKAYKVELDDRADIPNLAPVIGTAADGKAIIFAVNKESFAAAYENAIEGKGAEAPAFAGLTDLPEGSFYRLRIPGAGALVQSLAKEEELALAGELPDGTPIADIIKGAGDLQVDCFLKDGRIAVRATVALADEATTQNLAALATAGLMFVKGSAAQAGKVAADAASSITVKAEGSTLAAEVSMSIQLVIEELE
ncbi:MAG: hypothetical protein IJ802_05110 [Kiritimatiellae bacterium]|nr:hypothetical protein [Kiritimatiellia bacterium]